MFQFGIGGMFAVPNGGNLAPNALPGTIPPPQQFGTLQDVQVEFDQKLVSLMGQNKFPDDVAPSDMKVSGKGAFAFLSIDIFNQLYFADAVTTGYKAAMPNEAHTIPATPYQVTLAPPSSGTWVEDQGVRWADGSGALSPVTGTPTTGEYAYSAGVYTFAAADTTKAVLISYIYSVSASGKTLSVSNKIQGYGPKFELWLLQPYQGPNGLHLWSCRASKMSMPMKRDGYVVSDFEFEAFANAAGNVFEWFQASF